jgi:ABC-type phosphate transport system substrate-binding protein
MNRMAIVSGRAARSWRPAAGLALWLLALLALPASAEPVNVVITLPTGAQMPASLASLVSSWRHAGQISDALWLESNQKADQGFATLVILEFPNEGHYEFWVKEEASKLTSPLSVKRADVLTHGEITPRDSNRSIFLVKTYDTLVAPDDYERFVAAYVAPDMANQRAQKILIRYTMYLPREAGGGKGRSLLVMEYRDSVAFGRRDAVNKEFEQQLLATNAVWKKLHESKEAIRRDVSETVAAYVELPPPQLTDLPAYKPEFKVVGSLRIVGSELKNAVDQLAIGFQRFHPDAKLTTSHTASSEGGIAGLYTFTSDVAPMGDDAKITDLMPFYNSFGYMPTEISVATGGYEKRGSLFAWAIVVSKDNPLDEISVEELKNVFGAERSGGWELVENDYRYTSRFARTKNSNIRTWGQLGLTGEYANREIETFGYASPGFATYFERNWFHWSKKWNPNFMEYVEEKQTSPDAAGATVASTVPLAHLGKYAIGIAALMHVKNYPNIKVLKISEKKGDPAIPLTPENVASRKYPLIRDGFFYVNKPPGERLDPKVREFMRFVLSREGQEIIARVGYYYPLSAEYLDEQLKRLEPDRPPAPTSAAAAQR